MKHHVLLLIFTACFALAVIGTAQTTPASPGENKTTVLASGNNTSAISTPMPYGNSSSGTYVMGELLVRFNPEVFPNVNALSAQAMQAHATIGAVRIESYQDIAGLELVRLPPAMSVQDGIAYYTANPAVMYAEPNAVYSIAGKPGLNNTTPYPPPAGNTTSIGDLFVQYNTTAFASPNELQVYANATNAAINASVVTDYSQYGMAGLQLIDLQKNMTVSQGISYYQNVTHVQYAEPNVQYKAEPVNQTPGSSGKP